MIELLRNRRSIRKFTTRKVEKEKINILAEAALRSPTSRNRKAWEFIFTEDPDLLKKLSRAKTAGSAYLEGCTLAVVVCGDEEQTDVWVEDCSIASILLQMTGQSLGLGSCWAQIRKRMHSDTVTSEAYIQDLLGLPGNFRVESVIGFGYPFEKKEGIPLEELDFSKIQFKPEP